MRGIANLNHAAAIPFVECDPIDRSAMDLLVALKSGQIFFDDSTKTGEATAQAVEPAGHWLVTACFCDVAKAVGVPLAYRAQSEEAALAEQKLQCADAPRTGRRATLRHAMAPE